MDTTHDPDKEGGLPMLVFSLRGLFLVCPLRYGGTPYDWGIRIRRRLDMVRPANQGEGMKPRASASR